MRASFVDLRNKSSEILQALRRNERITVLYRGKPTAIMSPVSSEAETQRVKATDHPSFGMWSERDDLKDPADHVRHLRKGRFDAR